MKTLTRLSRNPLVRGVIALAGFGVIALIVRHAGPGAVWAALVRASTLFPLAMFLEGVFIALEMLALRALYGADRGRLPPMELVRAGVLALPVMALLPMGRAVAEAARAAMLAKHAGPVRASVAAARVQGVLLLANTVISIACAVAALVVLGPTFLPAAIALNCVLTFAGGAAVLYACRHVNVGAFIARFIPRIESSGPAFDAMIRAEPAVPWGALGWAVAARVVQVIEYVILVVAVGGHLGLLDGLIALGVHLVGAAVGDFVPASVGLMEASFALAARSMSLSQSDALSIALLLHIGQVVWLAIAFAAGALWPPAETREAGAVVA